MITAREPKQEDATDTDPLESRRGMRLVHGGRDVSNPLRKAIGSAVFVRRPRTQVDAARTVGKKITSITDDVAADPQRAVTDGLGNRASGAPALAIAIAVAASGVLVNYLFGDRRKR